MNKFLLLTIMLSSTAAFAKSQTCTDLAGATGYVANFYSLDTKNVSLSLYTGEDRPRASTECKLEPGAIELSVTCEVVGENWRYKVSIYSKGSPELFARVIASRRS